MSAKAIETSEVAIEDKTVKQLVRDMLDNLPDDVTWERLHYHLYVCEAIEKGLREMEETEGIPQEEAEEIMQSWFE